MECFCGRCRVRARHVGGRRQRPSCVPHATCGSGTKPFLIPSTKRAFPVAVIPARLCLAESFSPQSADRKRSPRGGSVGGGAGAWKQGRPGQPDGGNGAAVFVAWRYAASLVGNGPLAAPSGGK